MCHSPCIAHAQHSWRPQVLGPALSERRASRSLTRLYGVKALSMLLGDKTLVRTGKCAIVTERFSYKDAEEQIDPLIATCVEAWCVISKRKKDRQHHITHRQRLDSSRRDT